MKLLRVLLLVLGVVFLGVLVATNDPAAILAAITGLSWRLAVVAVFPFVLVTTFDTLGWRYAFLRDRVFQTLDRNARLRYQVLSTTAGLRTMPPFNLIDRVIAAGFLPDVRAHERSPHPMSS